MVLLCDIDGQHNAAPKVLPNDIEMYSKLY